MQEADRAAGPADIVVGMTSHNDERTIGAATRAVCAGLARYFGSSASRILLADAGSTDGTREAARAAVGSPAFVELAHEPGGELDGVPYHGRPGRAAALRAILEGARRLEAKACVIIDASLDNVEPEWIERLVAPVAAGTVDYVSPYYLRRVNEGAITRSIVYPMFRALYGVRLRQPAAGEFGCSATLLAHLLEEDLWEAEGAAAGIDLWLAAAAVGGGFRACEAALGRHGSAGRASPVDVSTVVAQVVGALFADLELRVDTWHRVRGSAKVELYGAVAEHADETAAIDVTAHIESFRLGYRELRDIWTWILPPRTIVELRRATELDPARFALDDRLWAGIIYDFALGYAFRVMPRDHLLRSLTPLYAGWLASFVLQMRGATLAQIEERIESLCLAFEAEKRHLISRWRWPERLR